MEERYRGNHDDVARNKQVGNKQPQLTTASTLNISTREVSSDPLRLVTVGGTCRKIISSAPFGNDAVWDVLLWDWMGWVGVMSGRELYYELSVG